MGSTYEVDVATDAPITNANETVIATLTNIASQRAGQRVEFHGHANITTGTATTSLVFRIREDSLTGSVVDELETDVLAAAVGSSEDHDVSLEHTPAGELSTKTYVLTVTQTSATGAGTCNHGHLRADLLP